MPLGPARRSELPEAALLARSGRGEPPGARAVAHAALDRRADAVSAGDSDAGERAEALPRAARRRGRHVHHRRTRPQRGAAAHHHVARLRRRAVHAVPSPAQPAGGHRADAGSGEERAGRGQGAAGEVRSLRRRPESGRAGRRPDRGDRRRTASALQALARRPAVHVGLPPVPARRGLAPDRRGPDPALPGHPADLYEHAVPTTCSGPRRSTVGCPTGPASAATGRTRCGATTDPA